MEKCVKLVISKNRCNTSRKSRRLYKTRCWCSGVQPTVWWALNQAYWSRLGKTPTFLQSENLLQYSDTQPSFHTHCHILWIIMRSFSTKQNRGPWDHHFPDCTINTASFATYVCVLQTQDTTTPAPITLFIVISATAEETSRLRILCRISEER